MSPGQHEQSSGQVAHPHHLKGTARSLVTVVVHGYGGTPCTLHQWTTLGPRYASILLSLPAYCVNTNQSISRYFCKKVTILK